MEGNNLFDDVRFGFWPDKVSTFQLLRSAPTQKEKKDEKLDYNGETVTTFHLFHIIFFSLCDTTLSITFNFPSPPSIA